MAAAVMNLVSRRAIKEGSSVPVVVLAGFSAQEMSFDQYSAMAGAFSLSLSLPFSSLSCFGQHGVDEVCRPVIGSAQGQKGGREATLVTLRMRSLSFSLLLAKISITKSHIHVSKPTATCCSP